MDLIRGNALFGGFGQGIRTMYVSVRRPRLVRGWSVDRFGEDSPPATVYESVNGEAHLRKDKLTVIGTDQKPTRTLTFSLRAYDSPEDLKAEWERLKANHIGGDPLEGLAKTAASDDEQKRLQYFRNVYAQFEKAPPTAFLGFWQKEWEFTIEEHWWLECKIPKATFEQLAADIRRNQCHRLTLGIELAPMLVDDEYAPPSFPVTFGVFRMGEHDGGYGQGWLTNVSWRASTVKRRRPIPRGEESLSEEIEPSPETIAPIAPALEESLTILNNQISALAQSTRRGFTYAIVILIVVALIALR